MNDQNDGRILVLTATSADAGVVASVIERLGYRAFSCADVRQVCAEIGPSALALLITEEAVAGHAHALGLCIARQAQWSDLPVIVMTSRRVHGNGALRQELFDRLGHITLLQRPLRLESLTSAVVAAVRTRLRQYELRGRMDDLADAAARLEGQVRDRTKTLEQALQKLHDTQQTLLQAQRLEAVGQMTGGIAHDFNNLLQVIMASTELARRLDDKPEALAKVLSTIRHAAQRGSQLTQQLLAFASRQPLQSRKVDLERQLPGLRALLERSLARRITVAVSFQPGLWPVLVDVAQLEVAVLNLVVNAGDAIEESGSVIVRAFNEALSRPAAIQPTGVPAAELPTAAAALPPGDYVCIEVEDTGTGMSEAVAARVFEPFFTTKQPGKGTGLGLSQVYGFVRQTGGAVAVRSTSPAGTIIALWLPRAPHVGLEGASREANPPDTTPGALSEPRQLTVLLVEDDPIVAAAVSEMIKAFGHTTILAKTAEEAFAAPLDDVDLVFSDVIMPGRMDGLDLGLTLRDQRPGLPVLLTSGYAGSPERVAAAGLPLLSKPYTPAQWSAAVDALLSAHGPRSQG